MRRVHVPEVRLGLITPDAGEGHHLRDVLRVKIGESVEVFDAAGRRAAATIFATDPVVTLQVESLKEESLAANITVASAVPKGDRAEWLVEKLSELGTSRFIPLRTARSVVHPEGKSKTERWQRIAVESAKQCRRPGLLGIDPLTDLKRLLATLNPAAAIYLSTRPDAEPIQSVLARQPAEWLLIGPEGDWSPEEEKAFDARGLTAASLGPTILRVETAAMLAAGVAMLLASNKK
ncbi:MAG: Ribosomal small subunit methyltransferase [Phycisphaerales bacterium]|nr:Ribosomal small subunit methyltransferase [Phycisphaerales bacterium]